MDKPTFPWDSWVTLSLVGLAVVCLSLFSYRSLRAVNPILDFGLFRNKVFRVSNLALFFLGAGFFSIIIFLPPYMVNVVGVSATQAGVALIPLSLGLVFGSIVSGQLVSRFGHYRWWMLGGLILLFVGVLLLHLMTPDVSYWTVVFYMLICGLGIGPSMPLYTLAIQNAVDVRQIGQATSASQFFHQIGGALGAALMGTLLATSLASSFSQDMPPALQQTFQPGPSSSRQLQSSGGSQVGERIRQAYDQVYQRVAQAVEADNTAEVSALTRNPLLGAEMQQQLQRGLTKSQLPAFQKQLQQQAQQTTTEAQEAIRKAFNTAIIRIYFYTLFIVAIGFVVTWFVPEIPLRKSNQVAEPAIAS